MILLDEYKNDKLHNGCWFNERISVSYVDIDTRTRTV